MVVWMRMNNAMMEIIVQEMVVRQLVKLKLDMDANNLPKAIKL
jgi:hypothetical protein